MVNGQYSCSPARTIRLADRKADVADAATSGRGRGGSVSARHNLAYCRPRALRVIRVVLSIRQWPLLSHVVVGLVPRSY